MKRHPLDPLNFFLLKSLDAFAQANGLSIMDIAAREGLVDSFRSLLQQHISHEARIHGIRVESMFAHVVAAMGHVALISEEDSGALFEESGNLRRPDFRIITNSHDQMLVEVKNFYQKGLPTKPYRMSGDYLRSLKQYAELNKVRLRIAIYWSRWNMWSLLDAARLDESQKSLKITMSDAFLHNEMYLLGDRMIGTVPPLSFRLYADPTKPRSIDRDGKAVFTVAKACLCCNDTDIHDPEERRIAWYLMLNGEWQDVQQIAETKDGVLEYVEVRASPYDQSEELPHEQSALPCKWLGYLSYMVTSQYLRSTSNDNQITNLTPDMQPNEFGLTIPNQYKGSILKLWIFTMLPKHIDPPTVAGIANT